MFSLHVQIFNSYGYALGVHGSSEGMGAQDNF
jgi:hypothetical protein